MSKAYKKKKLKMCTEQVNGLSKLMNLVHHWMERLKMENPPTWLVSNFLVTQALDAVMFGWPNGLFRIFCKIYRKI